VVEAAADFVTLRGRVVFAFGNTDLVTDVGDLTVWTTANGIVPFTTDAAFSLAASDDGARILATEATSSDGQTTDLVLGGTDGGSLTTLRTVSRTTGCTPAPTFVGTRFIVMYCDVDSTSRTISSVDPVSGEMIDLQSDVLGFIVVPETSGNPSRELVTIAATGDVSRVPISGEPPTALAFNADSILGAPDGTAVIVRSGAEVRRVPLDGGDAVVLASDGVAALIGMSPNGDALVFTSNLESHNGFGDLLVMSALVPEAPGVLTKEHDSATVGRGFTADGTRVLFATGLNDYFVGRLHSAPAAGGTPTQHGVDARAAIGYAQSRIVFLDDYAPIAKRPGRGTLRTVDSASSDVPAIIATHAGSTFVLSQANDRVFFSFDDGSDRAGVYSAPLP
jgi:hypothetical protein